jgi:hypothetical protein
MHAGTTPKYIYAATLLFMMHYLGFRVGPAITIVGPRQNLKDTHVFQLAHLRISCRMQVIRMTFCIQVMCGARRANMRSMKDVRIMWVVLERRKCMY